MARPQSSFSPADGGGFDPFTGGSDMDRRARAVDWEATSLGNLAGWPLSLRLHVRTVLDSPLPMLLMWGDDLVQLYNDAARGVLGTRHPSGLGRPFAESWAELLPNAGDAIGGVLAGKPVLIRDWPFRLQRDGQPVLAYFTVSCSPLHDDVGRISGILATAVDTTAELHAQAELRHAVALLEGITGGTDDLIAALDQEFRFRFFNDAYAREFTTLWGRPPELGLDVREILAPWPGELAKAEDLWGRALSGEAFSIIMAFGPSDDAMQHYDMRFSPVIGSDRRQLGAAHILRNVTDRVRVQDSLQERERLARALARDLARERRKLAAIIEDLPLGVGMADAQGRILSLNRAGLELHGFATERDMLTRPGDYADAFQLRTPDGVPLPPDQWPLHRALRGQFVRDQEFRLVRKRQGDERIVAYDVVPVRHQGDVVVLVFVIQDLTGRKRTEEALRRSEERYALAARATDNAIWDWSFCDDLIHWNEGLAEIFGHDRALTVTTPEWWSDVIHPEDRERVLAGIRAIIDDPTGPIAWRDEYRFCRADGSWAVVTDRGYVARDEDGRAARMVGAVSDVTSERTMEAERERLLAAETSAREAAERSSTVKTQFLSVISHELRTPLTAVLGYTDLLESEVVGPINEKQRAYLSRVRASTNHLVMIIDEILTFSRSEAGREEVRLAKEDVAAIVRGVVGMLAGEARTRDLSLSLEGAEEPVVAITDGGKVSQVLVNLVGNAIRYTDAGSIDVHLITREDLLEVHVRDTGIGIPADRLSDIFDPFVQVDQSNTRSRGGTGLGLAICRKLSRMLGGDVEVQSELGVGSRFVFRLPRGRGRAGG